MRLAQNNLKSAKAYGTGARIAREFAAATNERLCFPLAPYDWIHLCSFMMQIGIAPQTCVIYCNHINYVQMTCGYRRVNLGKLPLFGPCYKALKKYSTSVRPTKLPIDLSMAIRMIDTLRSYHRGDFIWGTLLLTGILGLFRLGELTVRIIKRADLSKCIRVAHFDSFPTHGTLWLPKSKNDPYGQGCRVFLPRIPNSPYCPVWRLEHLAKGKADNDLLFTWDSSPHLPITRNSFLKKLQSVLINMGYDPKLYSGHSLRRGGAVTAERCGIAPKMIKLLGRWNSDCYKRYLVHVPKRVQDLNSWLKADLPFGWGATFLGTKP